MRGNITTRRVTTDIGTELILAEDDAAADTLPKMIWQRVMEEPGRVIIREKDFGIWQEITWGQVGDKVRRAAMALRALGLEKGQAICVLSNNKPEWIYADLGCQCAGGISSGVYPTDAPNQVEYLVNDSKTKIIFVEDEEQLDKILSVRENCPTLEKIIIFDMKGLRDFSDPMAMDFAAFLELGENFDKQNPGEFERCLDLAQPDDLAILVYTSGTTGPPKGAMISQRNIMFQCVNSAVVFGWKEHGEERLAFLPMCHVAERVGGCYLSLYTGVVSNYIENPDTVPENAQEVQPTIIGAVPRVWEKFYSSIMIALSDATPLQRWAYRKAIAIGEQAASSAAEERPLPFWLGLRNAVAQRLVLNNIRKIIGLGKCHWAWTGAAPISPDLIHWYQALGINLYEVYGQTENTALATANVPGRFKLGSVGRPVPFGEVRISDQGEILLRGEHIFMGYLNQPEKTAETIVDGWLHTGDVGLIDNEGYVKVIDRMKDIIITAGGKNITPTEIENELKFSPYISDAVVIGDRRKFLTCLIMIDHENVEKYAQDQNVPFTNFTSLTRAPEVVALINAEVEMANKKFARVETVKKFRLLEHQLDPEDDELTPTMKLKRKFVSEKYADLIEEMYQAA